MTTIDRNVLFVLLTILGLIAVPMGLAGAKPFFESLLAFPIVVGIELLVYFIASMVINARATIGQAVGTALTFTVIRAICALVGGFLAGILSSIPDFEYTAPWLNPITAVIQVLILVTAGPYLLAMLIPEMVGREAADQLLKGPEPAVDRQSAAPTPLDASPTGGFIQVFSFQELAAQLKKNPGLEGFVIFSDEGLVVWRDLPLKIDVEALTCRMMNHNSGFERLMIEGGLARLQRSFLQSRDHLLVTATLNQNFGLVLLFSGRTPIAQIQVRLSVIIKSTREYLQWKYPSLPMATGLSRDRIPVETM